MRDVLKLIKSPLEEVCQCFEKAILLTQWLDETKQIDFAYIKGGVNAAYFKSNFDIMKPELALNYVETIKEE